MKNVFGNQLSITLFGESHGPYIGAVLDGLAPGIKVQEDSIRKQLSKRRPSGAISTKRVEKDEFVIASGVYQGRTTGTSLCILIPNQNTRSDDYKKNLGIVRPGHADYTGHVKYHGFEDFNGGGHFSGRITAAIVAAGAIVKDALQTKGIQVGSHILSLGSVSETGFQDFEKEIPLVNERMFPVLCEDSEEKMKKEIMDAGEDQDSVGGVLETGIIGLAPGIGEPWFDALESMISHGIFSIPGVKGIQFGAGFDLVNHRGSEFNDAFYMQDGKVYTETNHNGGINGGISNGMPIVFRTGIKPTPSIYKTQKTVDLQTGENTSLNIQGRHDPSIIHRAAVVVDSMAAITVYDLLAGKFGTDYFCPDEEVTK